MEFSHFLLAKHFLFSFLKSDFYSYAKVVQEEIFLKEYKYELNRNSCIFFVLLNTVSIMPKISYCPGLSVGCTQNIYYITIFMNC